MVAEWLKKLFQPVSDGTRQLIPILVKKKLTPPEPTIEEFVSPLQEAVKTEIQTKQDIGYNDHCVNCTRQRQADARLMTAVETAADPQPWLAELYTALKENNATTLENTAEQRKTQVITNQASNAWVPSKRVIYGLATASAALAGTTAAKLVLDLYVVPWIIEHLPLAIGFLIQLLSIL